MVRRFSQAPPASWLLIGKSSHLHLSSNYISRGALPPCPCSGNWSRFTKRGSSSSSSTAAVACFTRDAKHPALTAVLVPNKLRCTHLRSGRRNRRCISFIVVHSIKIHPHARIVGDQNGTSFFTNWRTPALHNHLRTNTRPTQPRTPSVAAQ